MADDHQEHSGPYRSMCVGCVNLNEQLAKFTEQLKLAQGTGLHPNQGADRLLHRCIFCGEKLYVINHRAEPEKFGSNIIQDMVMCSATDEVITVQTGWWFIKGSYETRRNPRCPKASNVIHLHRHCSTCSGDWVERPFDSLGRIAEHFAHEPQKVSE